MKKSFFVALAMAAIGDVAHAQASVTLYGVLDSGLTYVSNVSGKSRYALTSPNELGNRWGVTASENLGGGIKSIATLEAAFNGETGAIGNNGTEFGRQAFVGLASDKYGTLTLGRQYGASFSAITGLLSLPAGGTWAAPGAAYGAHVADVDNLDSANRINNSIKYQSTAIGGFTVIGLYSFGGKAGDFTQNSIYDLGIAYENGPVKFGAGYLYARNPNFSFWGDKANDSITGSNMPNVIISGYASAKSQQIVVAGGGYTLGAATLSLVYSNVRFGGLGSVKGVVTGIASGYTGSDVMNTGEFNIKYQLNPAMTLAASYSYTRDSGANGSEGAKYQVVDVGALYSLSKQTSLYAVAAYQRASGINSLGAQAVASAASASSSNGQAIVTIGITKRF